MANDVSCFKVPGDSTKYSFNDADAENRIGALESTVNDQAGDIADNTTAINANASAIGTLSNLTTSAKGSLVAAINEVDSHADTNASAISQLISNVALTLTAATGVTLSSTSCAYLCGGKYLYIYAKGQATQAITNSTLCTVSGDKNFITASTVPIGIGTEWAITSVGYGFLSAKNIVGRVSSGQWFHINIMVPVA